MKITDPALGAFGPAKNPGPDQIADLAGAESAFFNALIEDTDTFTDETRSPVPMLQPPLDDTLLTAPSRKGFAPPFFAPARNFAIEDPSDAENGGSGAVSAPFIFVPLSLVDKATSLPGSETDDDQIRIVNSGPRETASLVSPKSPVTIDLAPQDIPEMIAGSISSAKSIPGTGGENIPRPETSVIKNAVEKAEIAAPIVDQVVAAPITADGEPPAPKTVPRMMELPANSAPDLSGLASIPFGQKSSSIAQTTVASLQSVQPDAASRAEKAFSVISARHVDDRSYELRLDPPELGSVRIEVKHLENGALKTIVVAERPDTLDLLRRHADMFRSEIGGLGFDQLDLQFESQHQRDEGAPARNQGARDLFVTKTPESGFDSAAGHIVPIAGGMDIFV